MHGLLAAVLAVAPSQITIDNIEAGAVVRHPLVALRGTAPGDSIAVGASWAKAVRFPVIKGQWAGFVELEPGQNMVLLHAGKTVVKYRLDYRPATSANKVLTVFLHASDEPPRYYTDRSNDRFQVREKLDVAMKLMQAATAEAMHLAGYGRRTFNLELEKDGRVKVHFIKLPKTGDELRAMEGNASWGYIYEQLKERFPEETTKWCGVLGFTRFDKTTGKALGHYALGGGAQALFGGGTMGWWPATLKEVPQVLADTLAIDHRTMFEDSANRRTVWVNVSTAYGAMLHELGHTFGLPHSPDRFSVMSRGFDHFARWFTVYDPPHAGRPEKHFFTGDERMRWDPFFASRLSVSPFFQPDVTATAEAEAPRITLEAEQVRIEAPAGIHVWGAERDDTPARFEELKREEKVLVLSRKELREKLGTDKEFRITVVDRYGRQATVQDRPTG